MLFELLPALTCINLLELELELQYNTLLLLRCLPLIDADGCTRVEQVHAAFALIAARSRDLRGTVELGRYPR